MTPARTPEGKVVLFRESDGQRFERWPVDARGMMASGEYTYTEPPLSDAHSLIKDDGIATALASGAPIPVPGAPDPVPHVTQANAQNAAQSPTGAPLIVSPTSGVQAAAPVQLPTGRVPGGKRGKAS
jgi:hypothetical protein